MKLIIIIPAFNEASVIGIVLKTIPKKIPGISEIKVLVVNDGSTDATLKVAKKNNVAVVSHIINRGLGAAIKTGLDWAKNQNADAVTTFDADGQHNPDDIQKIVGPILKGKADIVIGSRFKSRQRVPLDRLILNKVANWATFILFGVKSTDTQSGLRGFSRRAINLIDYKADRMEFSSEIFLESKRHNLKVVEVPIKAIYTQYSRSKGQKNTNAIPIFVKFLVKFFR